MEPTVTQVLSARRRGLYFPDLPRAVLSVRGKDRASFLHNLLSNDIKGLSPGQAKPACLLDRQGKVIFSCLAHALPEEILLEMAPFQLETARASLERYHISEAVELQEATGRFRVIAAHGPALSTLTLPTLNDAEGFCFPDSLLGMPGLALWIRSERAAVVLPAFEKLFQEAGIGPADAQAFEILRIEAGLPAPGKEITDAVILNELGREDFVSFTKGCFVGQEIVARIKYRAHPPRLLSGFLLEGNQVPAEASPILTEGRQVGAVTSACLSPTLGKPIALGFLSYGLTEEMYEVIGRGGTSRVKRCPLPFVQPSTSSG